jgi:putative aldouronate transport system substrate-binding protein
MEALLHYHSRVLRRSERNEIIMNGIGRRSSHFIAAFLVWAAAVVAGCTDNANRNDDASLQIETPPRGGIKPTGFPIVDKPITIRMMGARYNTHGEWKDMLVFKEYEKKTNIHIEWDTAPDSIFMAKRNIALAGGKLPDAFYRANLSPSDEVNYGAQGIIIPLNDLIDHYGPNIKAMFAKYPEIKRSITAPDGNIYSLPQVADYLAPRINQKPWINKKWLDKLHLSMPTTTDEYYQVLKAFKEQDPNGNGVQDEIPWSGTKGLTIWMGLRGAWGLGTTGGRVRNIDLDSGGKVRFYPADPRYKELLEYMARLYKEGLIDKEVFTTVGEQFAAKGRNGVVGSLHANNANNLGPEYFSDYVAMPALKGPHGDQLYSQVLPVLQVQGTFAITKANKAPEATMRWVDYFFSEEGSKFFRMGIEGETYDTQPSGDFQYGVSIRHNPDGLSLDQAVGQFSPWPGGGLPHMIYERYDKTPNSMPSALAAAKLLEPYIPSQIWPSFLFTRQEQRQVNALQTDIDPYVEEMRIKFITGTEPFSLWDHYVNTLQKMGVADLIDIYAAAFARYKQ